MKDALLVVSDIHGALSGAGLVTDALRHHGCTEILCLGDILYHGPRNDVPADYAPKQVIEIMNSLKDQVLTPFITSFRSISKAAIQLIPSSTHCSDIMQIFTMKSITVCL